jgi:hypothetical protein
MKNGKDNWRCLPPLNFTFDHIKCESRVYSLATEKLRRILAGFSLVFAMV